MLAERRRPWGPEGAYPDCLQLLREEPRTASARIRADYRAWQARAEAYVRARRSDVLIEITPESSAAFIADASLYRQAGYRGSWWYWRCRQPIPARARPPATPR
ncbi:zeta toxin family protein [Streptomyces sp. NPDC051985]|uniref:zeta toxin family protein n=1 Tax=Streptomyces sp. NPDC051985 TaxID=3155807 RepID=UPI003431CDC1